MIMKYDVAVIGAGPAGAGAAIFIARGKLSTLLIDADQGMTRRAQLNNHLGFVDGIGGPDFVDKGHVHAAKAGAVHVKARVASIIKIDDSFILVADDGQRHDAKQVILVDEQGRTTVAGIWAAGTCAGTSVHTMITSGDGARVAVNLLSALKGERHVDHDVLK
jgi:thioredoxin reductase